MPEKFNVNGLKPILQYRPTMLVIMDGCGENESTYGNAVKAANTPNLDALKSTHPFTTLQASGLSVGLPEGQMGNSEVGHLNIGAGRLVDQELTGISKAIENGAFFENRILLQAMVHAKKNHGLHLMGLLGPGGVHSHQDHLIALLKMAKKHNLHDVYIHAFLDGRDTPPRSADQFMKALEDAIEEIGVGMVATVAGRYYAMDRDKRWDRVQKAYDALTLRNGFVADSATDAIQNAYDRGENDEFVLPTCVKSNSCAHSSTMQTPLQHCERSAAIQDGDAIIFFNFRPDRARELTRAFCDPAFDGFQREKTPRNLTFVTMTEYDATMPNVLVAYPPEEIKNTFGAYLSALGLTQLRIAETEKYAHVTFFFNGGVEEPNPGEDRILIPSPKVATYDLQPEMSAPKVCDAVLEQIEAGKYDVIILNFANMDMVGHTGIFSAAVEAAEVVDACVGKIAKAILARGGQLLITADHGNSDAMLTPDGQPITAHSLNPVPLILVREGDDSLSLQSGGALSDVVPTMLDMMEIQKPTEMTGKSLLQR
ncbi:MAG: 2,3-bisphosphoglycerate-independent phosphoglycerate mutase [Clostridiales Family XIII bacterium]|jgi:2,3-bisphosphoglycerate-independent phosphoglycerate mutase|nr:2,3-bisphosphoglycerate-independent phosphoglycerate mutase [Clostridiales Family XIII bacterium]